MYAVNFIWHVQVAMIKCGFCSHMAQTRHWDVRRAPLSGSTQVMHIGACIHICTIIYIHINKERDIYREWLVYTYIYIYPKYRSPFFFISPCSSWLPALHGLPPTESSWKLLASSSSRRGLWSNPRLWLGNLLGLPSGKLTVCYGKSPCY